MTLEKHKPGGWRPLVSLMAANNETGAIQPVREAADIVHEAGGRLHSDAVQAAGRIPLDMTTLGTDMLTLSAHKIGGPKGVGTLVLKDGVRVEPLIKGGGQEGRRRAGTEAAPAPRMSLALSDLAWPPRLRPRSLAMSRRSRPCAISSRRACAPLPPMR
jgi:cysteine sulfinate desulfinase/cysteine desulfurase-like protein